MKPFRYWANHPNAKESVKGELLEVIHAMFTRSIEWPSADHMRPTGLTIFVEQWSLSNMLRLMKTAFAMIALLGLLGSAHGQPTDSFPLWPNGAPGALGKEDKDIPTLTPFLAPAEKASGLGCPDERADGVRRC